MYDLLDELKGDHSRMGISAINQGKNSILLDKELQDKLVDAESKLDKLTEHFEYLATTAEKSEKLNRANQT